MNDGGVYVRRRVLPKSLIDVKADIEKRNDVDFREVIGASLSCGRTLNIQNRDSLRGGKWAS